MQKEAQNYTEAIGALWQQENHSFHKEAVSFSAFTLYCLQCLRGCLSHINVTAYG